MEQTNEPSMQELAKDIYAKLDTIHAVLGFILEKTKLIPEPPVNCANNNLGFETETDDNLDARDSSGSVLP